jgi:diketogulonate reductase-like aldo/keto reductase
MSAASQKMRSRSFGGTQREVPVVGQGSWRSEESRAADVISALRRGLDLGMTHIDTAEMYGAGQAERIIARAIAGRRDEVFLVSKVLPSHAKKRATISACENSLTRLETDRLDCYLLHWPSQHPLEETIDAFETLVASGKIRSWGVSNFDIDDLERTAAIAGHGRLACNQVLYHLGERAIEHKVLPWCLDHGVALVAYTPYGQSAAIFDPKTRQGRALQEVAAAHGASARQIALAFLLRHPGTFVIPKSSVPSHVEENAGAAMLGLTDAEVAQLEAVFPLGRSRQLPML